MYLAGVSEGLETGVVRWERQILSQSEAPGHIDQSLLEILRNGTLVKKSVEPASMEAIISVEASALWTEFQDPMMGLGHCWAVDQCWEAEQVYNKDKLALQISLPHLWPHPSQSGIPSSGQLEMWI